MNTKQRAILTAIGLAIGMMFLDYGDPFHDITGMGMAASVAIFFFIISGKLNFGGKKAESQVQEVAGVEVAAAEIGAFYEDIVD